MTKVAPAGLWGLRKNDVILSINGHAVKHVDDVFAQLNAINHAPAQVQVRRDNAEQSLTLTSDEYGRIIAPAEHP